MNVLSMKHLCILLIVCWSSVVNGNAVGHADTQHSPLQLKSDGNNVGTKSEKTAACKDGFIQLESQKCYFFSQQKSSWHDALKVCQSMDATLAYPVNAIENRAIVKHLNTSLNGTKGWWLGGTDEAKEGEWVWTHNKANLVYTAWKAGQPNNFNSDDHCLQYWTYDRPIVWQWNDRTCTNTYPFICQQ